MRLIDADSLIELFEEKKQKCDNLKQLVEMTGMQAIIDAQPTAYDTEKVVADIEEYYEEAERYGFASAISDIVEVVKMGGVTCNNL